MIIRHNGNLKTLKPSDLWKDGQCFQRVWWEGHEVHCKNRPQCCAMIVLEFGDPVIPSKTGDELDATIICPRCHTETPVTGFQMHGQWTDHNHPFRKSAA